MVRWDTGAVDGALTATRIGLLLQVGYRPGVRPVGINKLPKLRLLPDNRQSFRNQIGEGLPIQKLSPEGRINLRNTNMLSIVRYSSFSPSKVRWRWR